MAKLTVDLSFLTSALSRKMPASGSAGGARTVSVRRTHSCACACARATETAPTGIVDENVAAAHRLAGFGEERRHILLLADVACVHVQPAAAPGAALSAQGRACARTAPLPPRPLLPVLRARGCDAHLEAPCMSASCAASKSVAITFAPDASSCRQNTRPSPPAAPVTTARTASSRIARLLRALCAAAVREWGATCQSRDHCGHGTWS